MFYVYDVQNRKFVSPRTVSLAGRDGPLATQVRKEWDGGKNPFSWTMSEAQILARLNVTDVQSHVLLSDLKPKHRTQMSLYRIHEVSGFSGPTWTPLCLRLETLYVDHDSKLVAYPSPRKPTEPWENVALPTPQSTAMIHEFLYLNAGTHRGRWSFGMVGNVNGALLWPDALRFFLTRIKPWL